MEQEPTTPPKTDDASLRVGALAHLLALQDEGNLTGKHLRICAQAFGRSPRTIRRWLANAAENQRTYTPRTRPRATLTAHMRDAVARWGGNIAAAHRELAKDGKLGVKPISYATFHRAVIRELGKGHLAGLSGGEAARRAYDVHFRRPRGHRNAAWEADHQEADVWVNVNGERRKPWVTLFVDCATDGVCGLAVTPQTPTRESILVAIRDALIRDGPRAPFGGIPKLIRVDRGKDFLCRTVEQALGAFSVDRVDLPGGHPELKGTVESVNAALALTLYRGLPGYTEPGIRGRRKKKPDPDEHLLTFEAFVDKVTTWVNEWNHEHRIRDLGNRTPAQAWTDDLTVIHDVDPKALHTYTLEPANKTFIIGGSGIRWKNNHYIETWMHGEVGRRIRIRYMPYHLDTIEVYDAATGNHLGSAYLSNQATQEQRDDMLRQRRRAADRLTRARTKAKETKKTRYAAVTVATHPQQHDAVTKTTLDEEQRTLRERVARAENPTHSTEAKTTPTRRTPIRHPQGNENTGTPHAPTPPQDTSSGQPPHPRASWTIPPPKRPAPPTAPVETPQRPRARWATPPELDATELDTTGGRSQAALPPKRGGE